MAFEFVLAHGLLEYHERYATDPRVEEDPFARNNTYHFLQSSPHVEALRGGITFVEHDMYKHISFGRAELLALDNTRLLQDACQIFVPVELRCAPKEDARMGNPVLPRGAVIGPRNLAHIKYIDPFVMVVKFTAFMGRRVEELYRGIGEMWKVAPNFARAKREMLRGGDGGELGEAFDVRPLPHVSAGSYTKEEFLAEDDEMPCALLVRRGDRWVGLVHGTSRPLCDVLVDVNADFNYGALDALDARPTHKEVIDALSSHSFPDDLLDEVIGYGAVPVSRPVGVQPVPDEDAVARGKRKQ